MMLTRFRRYICHYKQKQKTILITFENNNSFQTVNYNIFYSLNYSRISNIPALCNHAE